MSLRANILAIPSSKEFQQELWLLNQLIYKHRNQLRGYPCLKLMCQLKNSLSHLSSFPSSISNYKKSIHSLQPSLKLTLRVGVEAKVLIAKTYFMSFALTVLSCVSRIFTLLNLLNNTLLSEYIHSQNQSSSSLSLSSKSKIKSSWIKSHTFTLNLNLN